jgi:formylglycine-generating enzyme required for sulfatase activity
VTNKMYSVCVDEDVCSEPIEKGSFARPDYYGNPEFANYPVINVDWNMAKTYCEWAGRRLPTEAEWEKAARGTDERTYPWGEELIEGAFANFNNYNDDTTIVGNYEDGKSPYGAYDMAGNVWEWVNDWYGSTYYQISPLSNPLGPDSGDAKVLRGGTWDYDDYEIRAANRSSSAVSDAYYNIGFRCASSQ